ncbi:MAG: hypothetical protein GY694_11940 [Gammaproteobacteria bacterium]|nr:hypothetical protein [Gammaproteobacteria bacterium]
MSKHFSLLQTLVNNLSTRERMLVLLGILSVIYIIWDTFLIAPMQSQNQILMNERGAIQEQMVGLETRRILSSGLLKNSKRQKIMTEIEGVEKSIKNFDDKIIARLKGRVAPHFMSSMLNDVLQNNQNLELISIRNLPAVPFVSQKNKDNKNNKPSEALLNESDPKLIGIFMHSLELQLNGTYLEILRYLIALEELEWKIFWDQVNLEVLEYPEVKVKIKVHTFSLKDGWLSV